MLRAYVLFKKADKGLALTLQKKNVVVEDEGQGTEAKTMEAGFLPNEQAIESILANSKFGTMIKPSKEQSLVGQVFTFRKVDQEEDETRGFYIVKSMDAAKMSKNFIAILPKCLVANNTRFQTVPSKFQGLVLEIFRDQLPVISIQQELIALRDQIPGNPKEELSLTSGKAMIGVCNGLQGKSG